MNNEGATWEQIVGLAKSLDFRNRAEQAAGDPVLLARLVLEFHRTVVAQPLKRTTALPDERAA
jgi:hypothetical protein